MLWLPHDFDLGCGGCKSWKASRHVSASGKVTTDSHSTRTKNTVPHQLDSLRQYHFHPNDATNLGKLQHPRKH